MAASASDGAVDGRAPTWFPPASVAAGDSELFGIDLEEHFWVPERLQDKSAELIEVRRAARGGADSRIRSFRSAVLGANPSPRPLRVLRHRP